MTYSTTRSSTASTASSFRNAVIFSATLVTDASLSRPGTCPGSFVLAVHILDSHVEARHTMQVVGQDLDQPLDIIGRHDTLARRAILLESAHQLRTKNVDLPVQNAPTVADLLLLLVKLVEK